MSNHLAIATATAALRQVIDTAINGVVAGADVTTARPGDQPDQTPTVGVNIFLYGITPNAAWRNADLPTRRGTGEVAQRPTAALDLNYLLSFYGDDRELETQRLLGSVVRALHARPTLPREVLRQVVAGSDWLAGSDLAEAPEAVRFTPVTLNLEELSKLWSVLFQVPYALSVAYQGTVVTIEADERATPALPVRARTVHTVTLAQPVVERVVNEAGFAEPIHSTSVLLIQGRNLRGDVTRVRVGAGGEELEVDRPGAREIRLPLSSVPASRMRAGVQGVQVVHRRLLGIPPAEHRGEESNVHPFVLRPVVLPGAGGGHEVQHLAAGGGNPRRIRVQVRPTVGRGQAAALVLNSISDPGHTAFRYTLARRTSDSTTLTFPVPGIAAGTYLVRVQVDGAESPLETDAAGLYTAPRVVVP